MLKHRNKRRSEVVKNRAVADERRRGDEAVWQANMRADRARSEAFDTYMRNPDMMQHLAGRFGDALGRAVGEELRQYAEDMVKRPPRLVFDARHDPSQMCEIVRVSVPSFSFSYAVSGLR